MTQIYDRDTAHPGELETQVTAAVRVKVGDALAAWAGDEQVPAREREARGRALIEAALAERTSQAIGRGEPVLDAAAEQRVAMAVFDTLFGLGGFQPLLDDPAVENIYRQEQGRQPRDAATAMHIYL